MQENAMMDWTNNRNKYCDLAGKVGICFVYVNDSHGKWSKQEIDENRCQRNKTLKLIASEASEEHISICIYSREYSINCKKYYQRKDQKTLVEGFAIKCGYESNDEMYTDLIAKMPELKVIYVFMLKGRGRSYASIIRGKENKFLGSVFIWKHSLFENTLLHELLHMFGAEDLYMPNNVRIVAERNFLNSIMLYSSQNEKKEIDELTRYLIGWNDKPSLKAKNVLDEVSKISCEEYKKAREQEWDADYSVRHNYNATYYGPMKNGLYNGYGVIVFKNGYRYEGEFKNGDYYGKGKLIYTDGSVYTGDFINGEKNGKGVMQYSGGSRYEGNYKNDKMNGSGTYTFKNGDKYTGNFMDNHFHGKGRLLCKKENIIYEGDFLADKEHGLGMLIYPNGVVKEGHFYQGKYVSP